MTKENWYMAGTYAEGCHTCYVHLTEAELKAVQKFINQLGFGQHIVENDPWSGTVWCSNKIADVDFKIEEEN